MFTRVSGLLLRGVTFYNSTRLIGITGGVQNFGTELGGYNGGIFSETYSNQEGSASLCDSIRWRFWNICTSVVKQHKGSPNLMVI